MLLALMSFAGPSNRFIIRRGHLTACLLTLTSTLRRSMSQPISISISHKGAIHQLSVLPSITLSSLQSQLSELTGVPPHRQKLLYKGKKAGLGDDTTLSALGFKNGFKVQMLSSTQAELDALQKAEMEKQRKEKILEERARKPQVKVRSTGSASSSSLSYRFHSIAPLSYLPNPSDAAAVLQRLANDPAIQHVMQEHQFSVGHLTELSPREHPNLLGLNVNAGQEIKLRLRMMDEGMVGFRAYGEIRRVLLHELTHNVWGPHDNNFKELNSQLNREVGTFERAQREGAHTLVDLSDTWQPDPELEAQVEAGEAEVEQMGYVLGGEGSNGDENPEQRRQRILEAAMRRMNQGNT